MLIYPETKIYVLCPGNNRSETAERCHQLASQLLRLNIETYMIYLPSVEDFNAENPVDAAYEKYNIPYDSGAEDDEQNILIVPEVAATYLYLTKKARRVLWWVDVNAFLRDIAIKAADLMENILAEPMPRFFSFNRFDADIEHWAQSEYARQFLKVNGVPEEKIYSVGDHLTQNFIDAAQNSKLTGKRNLVAYRKTGGKDFTEVVKDLSETEWLPVEDARPEIVQKLFNRAKVYVDFGELASKDQLLREAALSNCVIITGKRGVMANDIDVDIPAEFKFEETIESAPDVAIKIQDAIKNFKAELAKQQDFRDKILREKTDMLKELQTALEISPAEKIPAGIIYGMSDIGRAIAEILFQQDGEILPKFVIDDTANLGSADVSHEQRRHYLNLNNHRLQIISGEVAKFLYNEGRIQKFIVPTDEAAHIDLVKRAINPADEDIIALKFEDGDNGQN